MLVASKIVWAGIVFTSLTIGILGLRPPPLVWVSVGVALCECGTKRWLPPEPVHDARPDPL
jgi:hypothetical protein